MPAVCWNRSTGESFVVTESHSWLGRRPLIVRKQRDGDALIARLKARDAEPLELPVMRMGAPGPAEQIAAERVFGRLDSYTMAVFISPYVAERVLAELQQRRLTLSPVCRCLAVGQGTAAVLRAAGHEVTAPSLDMTSEGLLELPELADLSGEAVIIFRGEGGRRVMDQVFRERGATVTGCLLYRREADPSHREMLIQAIHEDAFDVVVVHSGELLDNLVTLLPKNVLQHLLQHTLIVPHARVADKARRLGAGRIEIASNASSDAIEAALARCYS